MKSKLLLLTTFILILISFVGYSQEKTDYPRIIPLKGEIMERGEQKRGRIEIKNRCIKDTVEARIHVKVTFDNIISDTTKSLNVKSVKLTVINIKEINLVKGKLLMRADVDSFDSMERCVWNAFEDYVVKLMYSQPFSEMAGRDSYDYINSYSLSYFMLNFYLVPED